MFTSRKAPPADADLRALRNMQKIALFLLLVMVAVWLFSRQWLTHHIAWGFVAAFAEAAIVGALADWYAVTALFRRPMGLPLPHTAILPSRQAALADGIANFIDQHFLSQEALQTELEQIDFAALLAEKLADPDFSQQLGAEALQTARWLLEQLQDDGSDLLAEVSKPLATGLVDSLIAEQRHQQLLDLGLELALEYLHDNKYQLREKIDQKSRWWIPEWADEKLYDNLVSRTDALLQELRHDPDHKLRQRFDQAVLELQQELRNAEPTPALPPAGEHSKRRRLQALLDDSLQQPDGPLPQALQEAMAQLATSLTEQPERRSALNGWLRETLIDNIHQQRQHLSQYVRDTIKAWDGKETAERVELAIGKDLQYIRINGTVLGGLIGLAIHGFEHYM